MAKRFLDTGLIVILAFIGFLDVILGEIYDCPTECTGDSCTCDNNCLVCNNNKCSQCKSGYFKKNDDSACISCRSVFGDLCMFCQDYNGCGQCSNNQKVYDDDCNLWHCEGSTDPSVTDIINLITPIIDNFGIDGTYINDFSEWIVLFSKENEYYSYSDNEIKERYENYVDKEINIIQDGNNNFWERAALISGLTEFAQDIGIDENNPIIYGHNQFSDWYDDEIQDLFGDTSDDRRRLSLCDGDTTTVTYDPNVGPPEDSDLKDYAPQIMNQGACGSCWAFASTAQFDINYNVWAGRTGDNVAKFSEEYAVDCAVDCNGNDLGTCAGGSTYNLPTFYEESGHCLWSEYGGEGYNGKDSDSSDCCGCPSDCTVKPNGIVFVESSTDNHVMKNQFKAAQNANYYDKRAMQFRVAVGPSVLFLEKTGNFDNDYMWLGEKCDTETLDGGHAMTVVGQRTRTLANGKKRRVLEIRNSWGNVYDQGYFLMTEFVANTDCKPEGYQFNTFGDVCPPDVQPGDICLPSKTFSWLPKDSDRCADEIECVSDDVAALNPTKYANHYDPNCLYTSTFTDGCYNQCANGYFMYDRRYKCQLCDFDNCASCSDFVGCTQCNPGYFLSEGCPVNACYTIVK